MLRGISPPSGQILLFVLRAANMAVTTDQPFTKMFAGSLYDPQSGTTIANCKSGAFNTACQGGVYTGAGKTGTQIISSTQSWAGLTAVNAQVHPAIIANNSTLTALPILSLTTANSAALTADIFIFGACLD